LGALRKLEVKTWQRSDVNCRELPFFTYILTYISCCFYQNHGVSTTDSVSFVITG